MIYLLFGGEGGRTPQACHKAAMLPPEGALNMPAGVSAEPSLNEAAWEGLRGIVGLLSDGKDENRNGRFRRAG